MSPGKKHSRDRFVRKKERLIESQWMRGITKRCHTISQIHSDPVVIHERMEMCVDQSRHDGSARSINLFGTFWNLHLTGRSDIDDPVHFDRSEEHTSELQSRGHL